MKIRFWGTRGTRPTPGPKTLRYGGNTSCVEVRAQGGGLVIMDSGTGIAELGSLLLAEGVTEVTILVTHTHWDHIQGFPFFAPAFEAEAKITIVGPRGSVRPLEAAFVDQMDAPYFPLRLEQLAAELHFVEVDSQQTFEVAGMMVTPHPLHHPITTYGYRLDYADRTFVFATDNEVEPGADHSDLTRWCAGADLLVHDAQYGSEEYRDHVGWGHSSFEAALEVASAAGAARLGFFHHDPQHSDADVETLMESALRVCPKKGARCGAAFLAAEAQEIEI
ncbi:MAG: MBL fold metallo-hydrolase [Candidatus Dormibacteraceae bacterium]